MSSSSGAVRVSVRLHAELERYAPSPSGTAEVAMPSGSTVNDLFRHFGFPERHVIIAGINGQVAARDAVLKDGDRVDLVTPMTGG